LLFFVKDESFWDQVTKLPSTELKVDFLVLLKNFWKKVNLICFFASDYLFKTLKFFWSRTRGSLFALECQQIWFVFYLFLYSNMVGILKTVGHRIPNRGRYSDSILCQSRTFDSRTDRKPDIRRLANLDRFINKQL
jgi:hypothetical protein